MCVHYFTNLIDLIGLRVELDADRLAELRRQRRARVSPRADDMRRPRRVPIETIEREPNWSVSDPMAVVNTRCHGRYAAGLIRRSPLGRNAGDSASTPLTFGRPAWA